MYKKYPYLSDADFLKEVDESSVLSQYAKITLLNWAEQPLQSIEGRVTGGSISINGDSAIRRTCSLSSFVEEDKYDYKSIDSIFSLNKKVFLEIGVTNMTDKYSDYPIVWFPQGQYVIMGISLNHSTGGTDISLNLKDKMVLLDGECGGTLPASVTFNEVDDYDENGELVLRQVPIYQIIQEVVNHFGGIPISQILINDVDLQIRQVMKWNGETPLYQYVDSETSEGYRYSTKPLNGRVPKKVYSMGQDVGYIYTDFVYPDELVGEAGSSVCDILDKIKNTLGNFEYFFDLWGNFVFQEKKNYLNTRQTTVQLQGLAAEEYLIQMKEGMIAYKFDNSKLIVSISNTPKYDNIKNDFIVWGTKKSLDGLEIPIRYHLAIDDKPQLRTQPVRLKLFDDEYGVPQAKISSDGTEIYVKDWRTELYVRGLEDEQNVTDTNAYYIELMNEWRKIYDLEKQDFKEEIKQDPPAALDYFLDFIDENSYVGQYSIPNIGKRSMIIVDNTINCLFEPEIPNVIFLYTQAEDYAAKKQYYESRGEIVTQVDSDIYDNLVIGGSFNSAFVAIRDLLYQYTNYNETISITMVPIFHLEPNTRVSIIDDQTGTDGDFVITNITIPLDVGGTSSISAIRAMEKI